MGGVLLASAGAAGAQGTAGCPPSSLATDAASLPPNWSDYAGALARELRLTDHPWSCAGAVVTVDTRRRGPSEVEVLMPDGLLLRRHVDRPSELLPTVEGMLIVGRATWSAPPPPVASASEQAPAPALAPPPVDEHERPPPLVRVPAVALPLAEPTSSVVVDVEGELAYRVAGAPLYSTPGVSVGAGVRVGHVGITARLQFETLSAAWGNDADGFSADSWSVGLGVGWLFPVGRGVLGAGPTVAIRGCTVAADEGGGRVADEIAQARVGLDLHWRSRTRGLALLLGARGDFTAGSLFGSARDYNSALPSPPTWGAEATVGLSYGIRP